MRTIGRVILIVWYTFLDICLNFRDDVKAELDFRRDRVRRKWHS